MGLKQQAVGGVKWTSASAVIASSLQLVQVAVLARFLDKDDFGLMAIALFIIGISRIFIDMGISNALIHKQRVNKFQLSTLFWINILLGVIIFGLIILSSPLIAHFYDSPDLRGVINWIGVTFLIIPWGQQFGALLRRDMRFKSLAIRDILSKFVGLAVAVILAIKGFGVYALVYANLAGASVATLLLFGLGMKNYRPSFIFSYRSLKSKGFFSFGLFQMGEKLINYFNSNFDTILIGKLLGMEALGLYNIAKILTMKPYQILNPIITKVAFPVFAKVQNDLTKLKRAYLKVVNILSSTNAPVYLLMIVLAEPLIQIAFGPEWLGAVPILQLLSIAYICNSIGNPVGSLQLAKGRADLGFYWNLGLFVFLPATIWLGSNFGLIGVAGSIAIFKMIITLIPAWYFFIRPLSKASLKEYFHSFSYPIFIAIFAAILPFFMIIWLEEMNPILQLLIIGTFYAIGYVLLSFKMNKVMVEEVKGFLPRKMVERLGVRKF